MAESLIYELCKDVGKMIIEQGSLLHGVPEEAEELRNNLKRIEAVLKAAEQREMEADVKDWLGELKDVAYDIEDVLDDWRIAKLQMQDQFGTSSEHGNVTDKPKGDQVCFRCILTPSFWLKKTKSRHGIASTIKKINSRLDKIYEGKKKFKFPKSDTSSINVVPTREITTAYEQFTVLQSQEEDRDELIKKLVYDDFKSRAADRIPIISIVGMGGIGKTTLARLVYDNETVKTHFSKLIWVCVSNTFNALNVIKAIAEGLNLNVKDDITMQNVLTKIANSIGGLKFLIVLDDVWEESEGKWGAILACLAKGDTQGSRILMTTRNSDFSLKMQAVFALSVGVLSETNAWLLFSYYAFPEEDSNHRGQVEDIAKELVKKCEGLPLALQVLGRHMSTKTSRSEWQAVLVSKMWETSFEEKVFNSLAFSYLELRSEAKRCFAFCSVFPKDTSMSKNELIRLWMAQGYLQGSEAHEMEFVGEECFNSLVRRSFLQVTGSYDDFGGDSEVVMHDVIHDYAQYISNGEAYSLSQSLDMPPELGVVSAKLRHLSLNGDIGKFNCSYIRSNLKALRTIFLHLKSASILKELGSNKAYVRALDIDDEYERFEDYDLCDIRKLIHLRYVRLGLRDVSVLPSEICDLRYLQTLDLRFCSELRELPKEIERLTSLRHLLFADIGEMDSLPKGLGKLTSLRTLSCFFCSSLDREECSSLEDLRDLNNVRGEFMLQNLNRVADVSEPSRAMLNNKTQISRLTLEFGDGDVSLQSDVLEALKPSEESIEFISIIEHRGRKCPRWIGDLRHLKEVQLMDISTELLPELGMLCFLEKLSVDGANDVKHVGVEFLGIIKTQDEILFPKLTDLCFQHMSQWEYWEGPTEISRNGNTIMPSLRRLKAISCRALRTLPRFLEYVPLETLEVDSKHLPMVELVKLDDYSKRWRMGNILFRQTLKKIDTPHIKLKEVEAPIEVLEVSGQEHLKFNSLRITNHILSRFILPRWIMDLTYLKIIKLSGIEDECLPPLGSLSYLEDLIVQAEKVEKVGDEFLGISKSNNNDGDHRGGRAPSTAFIAFPRLKKLTFLYMSAWREWEDPVLQGNIHQLVIMPSLCTLTISTSPQLKSLPRFLEATPLQNLNLNYKMPRDMPTIQNTTDAEDEPAACKMMIKARSSTTLAQQLRKIQLEAIRNEWLVDWADYCVKLTELTLTDCGEASIVGLEVLSSLKKLEVSFSHIRRMGKETLLPPSLEELHIWHMNDWEEWENPDPQHLVSSSNGSRELNQHGNNISANINYLSDLRILHVEYCRKLKALPSFLRTIPLKGLRIFCCHALVTWWENEAGEDWHNWISTIPAAVLVDRDGYPGYDPHRIGSSLLDWGQLTR